MVLTKTTCEKILSENIDRVVTTIANSEKEMSIKIREDLSRKTIGMIYYDITIRCTNSEVRDRRVTLYAAINNMSENSLVSSIKSILIINGNTMAPLFANDTPFATDKMVPFLDRILRREIDFIRTCDEPTNKRRCN